MQPIKRILVPVDMSPCSQAALEYAVFLADRLEVEPPEVIVLHAWLTHAWEPPPVGLPWVRPGHAEMAAERAVEMFVADVGPPASIPIRIHLEHGHAPEVIVDVAKGCDLIVMGTHGRTGLLHLLLGSVAEKIVRHAPCPVVTVHAPGPRLVVQPVNRQVYRRGANA